MRNFNVICVLTGIGRIVQSEIDKGISPSRIIVGGFSQGGATALHYTLRSPHTLGGCVALSSWLPFRAEYPSALSTAARSVPIVMFHGTDDYVVGFEWGEGSYKLLKNMMPTNSIEFMPIQVSIQICPFYVKCICPFYVDV